jgi:hypothetical protein
LAEVIRREQVGFVNEDNKVDGLHRLAEQLLVQLDEDVSYPERCKALFLRMFAVETAVQQVVHGLQDAPVTRSHPQQDEDWESRLSTPAV